MGKLPTITAEIRGTIQGLMWMPPVMAALNFHIREGKTLKEMARKAVSCGDLQQPEIGEASLILTMTIMKNRVLVKKTKIFNLRVFPSIRDLFCPEELSVYPEGE